MKKLTGLLVVLAMFGLQHGAVSQTVSGRSFITGFELGNMGEGVAFGGSVQSAIIRSGSYAYRAHPVSSNHYIAFQSRSSGGTLRPIFKSSRFYVYVAALPLNGSVSIVKIGGSVTYNPEVDLNWDGTLTLADSWYSSIARSQNALSADGLWHRIEFNVGNGLSVYVDGVLWASGSGATSSYPAGYAISFGAGESRTFINATTDLYFDDVLVDGDSFSNTSFPGDGHVVLLRTIGDPATLNSWTNGAGTSSSLWMPVHNVPAAGMPPSQETNMSQIKNASHGTNLDYRPQVQSYLDAGIPLGSTINAVMAISNDGQESSKGSAKSGGVWLAGNPSQAAGGYSFDYGDAAGVIGHFPSGWASHYGPVASSPAVNLASPPVVAVRKSTGSNVDVDRLGVYVDYR